MKHETSKPRLPENLKRWVRQFDGGEIVARLLDLLDRSALCLVDRDQRILYWSRGAEQMLGLSRNDAVGRVCPEPCRVSGTDAAATERVRLRRNDGGEVEAEKTSRVLFHEDGSFAGGLVLLTRVSGRVGAAEADVAEGGAKNLNFHGIISRSPAMQPVFQIIENAAKTEATVLVRGESGSGKELVARAIHRLSSRRDAPFLAINCAALSVSLLESELFGHVKGAFTGAVREHTGLFQRADGGTLFLDEVAELPPELQAKLLRVLQEKSFIPVGGDRSVDVDVRIVAATHRSLREEVKSGRFREDLMYRLRVVPIFIPSLRERREDISLLLWHFIDRHNEAGFRRIERIEPQAMRVLLDHRWPGNVRELQNVVEYAFAVGRGATLRLSELPPEFREPPKVQPSIQPAASASHVGEDEGRVMREALERCGGKIGEAARMLGMSRATFWRKRRRYGI
ncbi:MAG: sigma-54 interaction domain-containing protein [Gammaproteobacteria bacterium]